MDRSRRRTSQPDKSVPRVHFRFEIALSCELLDGETGHLGEIAVEFARYLERRDEQIGMLAARDWALLVDDVAVRPLGARDDAVVDVRLTRRPSV